MRFALPFFACSLLFACASTRGDETTTASPEPSSMSADALGADLDRYWDPLAIEDFLRVEDAAPTVGTFLQTAPNETVRAAREELVHWLAKDWPTEAITLPPDFAPELPAGEELLFFAPRMFEPGASGYWSYAFSLDLEQPAPSADELEEWLELYYDGLLSAVARDAGREVPADPADVRVQRAGPRDFHADLSVLDTFTGETSGAGSRVELRARIHVAYAGERTSLLIVRVSPQPLEHAIWAELDAAAFALHSAHMAQGAATVIELLSTALE